MDHVSPQPVQMVAQVVVRPVKPALQSITIMALEEEEAHNLVVALPVQEVTTQEPQALHYKVVLVPMDALLLLVQTVVVALVVLKLVETVV